MDINIICPVKSRLFAASRRSYSSLFHVKQGVFKPCSFWVRLLR